MSNSSGSDFGGFVFWWGGFFFFWRFWYQRNRIIFLSLKKNFGRLVALESRANREKQNQLVRFGIFFLDFFAVLEPPWFNQLKKKLWPLGGARESKKLAKTEKLKKKFFFVLRPMSLQVLLNESLCDIQYTKPF